MAMAAHRVMAPAQSQLRPARKTLSFVPADANQRRPFSRHGNASSPYLPPLPPVIGCSRQGKTSFLADNGCADAVMESGSGWVTWNKQPPHCTNGAHPLLLRRSRPGRPGGALVEPKHRMFAQCRRIVLLLHSASLDFYLFVSELLSMRPWVTSCLEAARLGATVILGSNVSKTLTACSTQARCRNYLHKLLSDRWASISTNRAARLYGWRRSLPDRRSLSLG
ncbi:uncharacterized protein VDAG_09156 [Verticillium dahliae VdLs.17]|uniref:Uncharacterized protein n=1 Tax=Verticillium dahliae (strain VdLs.17 / ATCC MYA-4575 / FGSC 10137) TaxID=498257 RepID=G2XFN2_VERDV|nr:uncharacterized protein VDAG_09156 [Verticillium dahliae VdLs.17]EGY18630.1 hypothetical protein VDAG_09156 [Verticillium dahliae VdLs.17]